MDPLDDEDRGCKEVGGLTAAARSAATRAASAMPLEEGMEGAGMPGAPGATFVYWKIGCAPPPPGFRGELMA